MCKIKLNIEQDDIEKEISQNLQDIQIEYAWAARKYVEMLPPEYHKFAFYEAMEVGYSICVVFSNQDFSELLNKTEEAEGAE